MVYISTNKLIRLYTTFDISPKERKKWVKFYLIRLIIYRFQCQTMFIIFSMWNEFKIHKKMGVKKEITFYNANKFPLFYY